MENIAVSIIVPIYNVELYLDECLTSLENQTFQNIEVILVNDGSTDNSGLIAQKYVEKNTIFKLINKENGGLSSARNVGINAASGEYIYFLDSDDYLLENAIETLFQKSKQDNLDVLKFVAYCFTEPSKELIWTRKKGYKYQGSYPNIMSGADALQWFIDNNDTSYPSSCLIFTRRDTINKNNLRFREGIIHEDNLFHYELLSVSQRVSVLNVPLYCRRYRENSITYIPDWQKKFTSMYISTIEMSQFVKSHSEVPISTSNWYINYFIDEMIHSWLCLKKSQQKLPEVKKCMKQIRPIVYQFSTKKKLNLWFLFSCRVLYLYYIQAARTIHSFFPKAN